MEPGFKSRETKYLGKMTDETSTLDRYGHGRLGFVPSQRVSP